MDYQRFINQLPEQFHHWGKETVYPKSEQFQDSLNFIEGMTTANVMQLLNFAVDCMDAGEIYCEIGTYRGSTLIGALLNHRDRMAYAVDNFSEFDLDGVCLEALQTNLNYFGLEEQVYFCNQDFQNFLLELRELNVEEKIGVYFYDGAHDYRSTLLGLLLVEPFLADHALIILDDANWGTVQQACWDFLAVTPESTVAMELLTPVARHSTFWNGIQILSWDRNKVHNYSAAAFDNKRYPLVIQSIYNLQLLEQKQQSLETVYQEAKAYHANKQFSRAENKYQEYLLWRDDDAEAWRTLGILYYEYEAYQDCSNALEKAISLDSSSEISYYFMGCVLERLERPNQAIAAYQKALSLNPNLVDAYNNLGNLFTLKDQLGKAKMLYQQAIALNPNFFGTYLNLGNLYLDKGQLSEAVTTYQTALQLQPDNLDVRHNLNIALQAQNDPIQFHQNAAERLAQIGRASTAICHYQALVLLPSDQPEHYSKLAEILWQLNRSIESIEALNQGLRLYENSEKLNYELVIKLMQLNQHHAAIKATEFALEKLPKSYTFKLLNALMLPLAYDSPEEIEFYRDRFTVALQNLIQETVLKTAGQRENALTGSQRFTSFQLTYQAQSMLEPQQQYGRLIHQIMAANYPQWVQPLLEPAIEGKIRIGYVSHYFHAYSGTLWLTGWLKHCNHQNFEVFCYYTGDSPDLITQQFQSWSDRFHHIPNNLEAVCQQILSDQLHILVFPEIGMDPLTVQMAALRLASIQCTAWGHPVTSGLSTIDYYLSSQAMEPANAQAHYLETLVCLPKLGIAYPQPQVPPLTKTRAEFHLREDAIAYLCCQAPFKYLPQHDVLLVEIARRVPHAQFVFIRADILQPRLHRAFAAAELNSDDYCIFLPSLERNDYLMLNLLSDVYLDTLGFTGGNTTLDAIACGLPIVTCPGEFMRGRLSTGILQTLGVTNTIASNEADYVNIAVRLAQEDALRHEISTAMQARCSEVFDDPTCITALEEFYCQVVQERVEAATKNQ
ncbi:tetratricopeptide repeat protein [Phormidium sp. CLA17]|uniref:O-linked N-acetylglucosamine transferase family protein n=1 Tax=Leptolyngbya sp. Cla-17 TaxID=2803751 RepID=UPI001490B14F|nr:tetratricopeptide repeat protein [Leptolyngbya sp. Cla-17]MBM0741981.1 tetratricopeptide repeat protein [Leptolyngbya sp. Cla-17]